jgi:hypothetical protein
MLEYSAHWQGLSTILPKCSEILSLGLPYIWVCYWYPLTCPSTEAYHAGMSDLTNRIEALQAHVNEIAVHL